MRHMQHTGARRKQQSQTQEAIGGVAANTGSKQTGGATKPTTHGSECNTRSNKRKAEQGQGEKGGTEKTSEGRRADDEEEQ